MGKSYNMEDKYVRTMAELEKYACKWWPKEIREYADKLSILQILLDTQDKFISILKLTNANDFNSIFDIIKASGFSIKCFLKHLMILTDVGAEPLQRLNTNFDELYTLNGRTLKMETTEQVALYHSNVATYKQLGIWFDYLRKNNVYDNTKIILVADHGGAMRQMDELIHTEEWDVFKDVEGYFPLLMVKDFNAKEFTEDTTFMTNADVPTIAVTDTIENPVNPFTNKPINNKAKDDEDLWIITSHDWDIAVNNGNQFLPANWATVKDNIWVKENWRFVETNTVDPTTVK